MRLRPSLWGALREALAVARPPSRLVKLPAEDPPDAELPVAAAMPDWVPASIAGAQVQIEYRDSKGQPSTRRVTCRRLELRGGQRYLVAFCLERQRPRCFRADRILCVIDPATGEVHEPGEAWLLRFDDDAASTARWHYGLPVHQYQDFNAALNVLAFIARCDGQWHDLEMDAIEQFAAAFWMRAEIAAPFDGDAIAAHAARLGPDPETFFVSLDRCAANPVLSRIIGSHVSAVIRADGVHHPKELYWAEQIVEIMGNPA